MILNAAVIVELEKSCTKKSIQENTVQIKSKMFHEFFQ